jgi:hypothetical protein
MKRMLLVVLAVFALALVASVAVAQTQVTVYLANPNITLLPGQEVDVPVLISNATDLYGIDVRLAYNPAVVQAVKVTRGVIPQPDCVVWERFDNVVGMAYYVTTQLNPTLPANGSGVVVTIRLRAVASGQTPLALTVQAASRDGLELPVTVVSGQAIVGNPAPVPTVVPTVAPPAPPKPPVGCTISRWSFNRWSFDRFHLMRPCR